MIDSHGLVTQPVTNDELAAVCKLRGKASVTFSDRSGMGLIAVQVEESPDGPLAISDEVLFFWVLRMIHLSVDYRPAILVEVASLSAGILTLNDRRPVARRLLEAMASSAAFRAQAIFEKLVGKDD